MQLTILGCNGGIAPGKGTTSFLINDDTLIDAGTGLEQLSFERMQKIRHIFLTHSHLDHISHLPFLLNNLIGLNLPAIDIYGLPHTISALTTHIFNNTIWPDFTTLPSPEAPCMRLKTLNVGDTIHLDQASITALPASHAVPTVGYWVGTSPETGAFAFSGDCHHNAAFWESLNQLPPVKQLIIDNQYLEKEYAISELAKHYYAASLKQDLPRLHYSAQLFITHLPPHAETEVFDECKTILKDWAPMQLKPGQVFDF